MRLPEDEIQIPAHFFSNRSPRGFSIALQSSDDRMTSLADGDGLLSVSIRTMITVTRLTRFNFFNITKHTPSYPGVVTEIDVVFSAMFTLHGQEPITLSLPGYDGAERSFSEYLNGHDGPLFSAAWYPDTSKLVFYLRCAASRLSAGRRVHLSFPLSMGIQLPASGLNSNYIGINVTSPSAPPMVNTALEV